MRGATRRGGAACTPQRRLFIAGMAQYPLLWALQKITQYGDVVDAWMHTVTDLATRLGFAAVILFAAREFRHEALFISPSQADGAPERDPSQPQVTAAARSPSHLINAARRRSLTGEQHRMGTGPSDADMVSSTPDRHVVS